MPLLAAGPDITPQLRHEVARCPGRRGVADHRPVEALRWDSGRIPREAGFALCDAFASKEKASNANAGMHVDPLPLEAHSATRSECGGKTLRAHLP
ncbi:hypothetical protein ACIHAA_19050 [Streptomyces sp. NPDC052040]|uniref:hypothetical protein n=1 Tax=unclassified Streptomyces TaxID=2593676 RepID=UPI0037CF7942